MDLPASQTNLSQHEHQRKRGLSGYVTGLLTPRMKSQDFVFWDMNAKHAMRESEECRAWRPRSRLRFLYGER